MISFHGKDYFLGCYQLGCDAAMAHDRAALSIGPHWRLNFASYNEYNVAREMEMKQTGLENAKPMKIEEVSLRVKEVVGKVWNLDDSRCDVKAWVSVQLFIHVSY